MKKQTNAPADSRADRYRPQLNRREFLSSIVAAVTSVFIESNDPPDLPENIPFGPRWHIWWPGTLDRATIDRMVWAWDWAVEEQEAREILQAAARREYSVEELRRNADINRIYKEMRPPREAYLK